MLLSLSPKRIGCVVVACLCVSIAQTDRAQTRKHRQRLPPKNPFIDRQLSGPVTLTSEWLELKPTEALIVVRDWQEVAVFPNPPIKMVDDPTGKRSLIPADGRDATIEAELIASNGVTYHSRPGYEQSMTGNLYVTRYSVDFKDLPRNVTYTKVRIRSSAPYPVSAVVWRCYNWVDVHH
jgi:hypothetical protein